MTGCRYSTRTGTTRGEDKEKNRYNNNIARLTASVNSSSLYSSILDGKHPHSLAQLAPVRPAPRPPPVSPRIHMCTEKGDRQIISPSLHSYKVHALSTSIDVNTLTELLNRILN